MRVGVPKVLESTGIYSNGQIFERQQLLGGGFIITKRRDQGWFAITHKGKSTTYHKRRRTLLWCGVKQKYCS